MRIANLLFASAAFADKNIDQLTKKVRFFHKNPKIFFRKFSKFFSRIFRDFFRDENGSVSEKIVNFDKSRDDKTIRLTLSG